MLKTITFTIIALLTFGFSVWAQGPPPAKKTNQRPVDKSGEPYDKATVEVMTKQCVKLETELGVIEMEMFPESAPETVRNFLNLVAIHAFDGTKFSRIVPNFVVQGGNLGTREKITQALIDRSRRTIQDEPSQIKHVRGIVSMARPDTPNGASTHFFILVNDSSHLDGKFAAFGRVMSGMEFVDAMNKMPVDGDKPTKPVGLTRATIYPCPAAKTEP